ncbi:hypothetical protein ACFL4N_09330, partial [Thermodesulfobacteriota bacterium]
FDADTESPALSNAAGFGLFSVMERMTNLEGSLKIVSDPGEGCTAILSAPYSVEDSRGSDDRD